MATITQGPLAGTDTGTPDAKADETKTEKPKAQPRDYQVGVTVKGTAEKIKSEIDRLVGDGRGEVYVVLGTAKALQPKLALQKYGQDTDLDGKYTLAAAGAFKEFTVKSEAVTKRSVKIS